MVYGIIHDQELLLVGPAFPGAQPVIYGEVPQFDQATHYAIQQPPVDMGDHIFLGVEVRPLGSEEPTESTEALG